MTHFHFRPD
ncbi:hypothetical protein YPPY52_2936, partial [Yersinia pestis PY-52]